MEFHAAHYFGNNLTLSGFLSRPLAKEAKPLGQGHFGVVFEHPERADRVIKVTCDTASRDYLLAGTDNPHIPRVFGHKLIGMNGLGLDLHAFEMERLAPVSQKSSPDIRALISDLDDELSSTFILSGNELDNEGWAHALLEASCVSWLQRSIAGYLCDLGELFLSGRLQPGSRLDYLGVGNTGERADGTPVFYDPVYSRVVARVLECGYYRHYKRRPEMEQVKIQFQLA